MNITCIIVDDEPLAQDILEHYISQTQGLELLGKYENVIEAMEALQEIHKPIDIVFLYVQMQRYSGIDLMNRLKDKHYFFILTTAYPESFLKKYNLSVLDYLAKPIPYERFLEAVGKVKNMKSTRT